MLGFVIYGGFFNTLSLYLNVLVNIGWKVFFSTAMSSFAVRTYPITDTAVFGKYVASVIQKNTGAKRPKESTLTP